MTLTVDGLPECAQPPFTLMAVCAAGEPSWTESPDPVRRMVCLHVTVPLLCQVRDGCGSVHTGRSCLEVDTALRLPVPQGECWRNALMVLPCVRLVCVPGGSSGACFDVQLEVLVESYMVRWEPCLPQSQRPACPPDLPLYPQPRLE